MAQRSTALAPALVTLLKGIRADALPESTRSAVVRNTLQVLGVARLGLVTPVARDAVGTVDRYERGEQATIVGHGVRRSTPSGAAFANTLASHADFREDTHSESASHPGVVVIPAVLAALEVAAVDTVPAGRFVSAVVAGHEVIGRLGSAAASETTARGFRPASVYTTLGAAVAAAIALDCTPEQQVNAIAIAAQGSSGLNHPFAAGSDEWFLAPALAARNGLTAALLARSGVRGSSTVIEGRDGVFAAFAGGAVAEVDLTPPSAGSYAVERTRLKAALTCGWNQSLVNQLDEFKALADRFGATLRLTRLRPSGRGADVWDELHPLPEQQRELYDWLMTHTADGEEVLTGDSFFHLAAFGESLPGLNLCGAGRVVCLIDPIGDVYACPFAIHDNFLAGNLLAEGGFQKVWQDSALFNELRSPQTGGACSSCQFFDSCRGGCMAAKFFTGLPLDGPDPECVQGYGEHALAGARVIPAPSQDHSKATPTRNQPVMLQLGTTRTAPPVSACAESPLAGFDPATH